MASSYNGTDGNSSLQDVGEHAAGFNDVAFPASFGHEPSEAETYIASLDARTGCSLKLTVLNPAAERR